MRTLISYMLLAFNISPMLAAYAEIKFIGNSVFLSYQYPGENFISKELDLLEFACLMHEQEVWNNLQAEVDAAYDEYYGG